MKKKITINLNEDRDWGATFGAIPGWDSQRLREAKVMVVGAGALGNEVVKNLTLLNIGHLFIVDFDIVEYNNLAKSVLFTKNDTGAKKADVIARNLKLINDGVKTQTIVGRPVIPRAKVVATVEEQTRDKKIIVFKKKKRKGYKKKQGHRSYITSMRILDIVVDDSMKA